MELTDAQLLTIASIVKSVLGDAYWLNGSSYCYTFERQVMYWIRSGNTFDEACNIVCFANGWGSKRIVTCVGKTPQQ